MSSLVPSATEPALVPTATFRPNFTGLRGAFFDLDGTLIRTFIDFDAMRRSMQELSAQYGTAATTASSNDILEIVDRMTATLGGTVGETARQEAFARLEAMELSGCANPQKIPDAAELLTYLRTRHHLKIAIITRNCRRVARDLIAWASLPCDLLVAREDTRLFKPHPEPVLLACRVLNLAPADTFMVGDFWADIAAGKAAGVRFTVGIQWSHDPPDRFARCRPDWEISDLRDLIQYR